MYVVWCAVGMVKQTLTGTLRVALPPSRAFRLFTAVGERAWVDGWDPRFPVPVPDDAEPGTVFETDADGHHGTWMVVDRDGDLGIRYARVVTGRDAGTVTVRLGPSDGHSLVTVTYDLTPLSRGGADWLERFAADYPSFLAGWADAIERHLATLPR
jgi:hypothetical protein